MGGRGGPPGLAETVAQRGILTQAPKRPAERVRVARRDDQTGAFMLSEAACRGSNCVWGDHGYSLVEGFVGHQPPTARESHAWEPTV
jgi:hypothetical protein